MNTARPFAILTAVLALVIGTPLLVVAAHEVEPRLTSTEILNDVAPEDSPESAGEVLDSETALVPFEVFQGEGGLSF